MKLAAILFRLSCFCVFAPWVVAIRGTSSRNKIDGERRRNLKGGKKMKMKKAPKGCDYFTVKRIFDEINIQPTSDGDSWTYPFYDMEGYQVGYYFDSSTFVNTTGSFEYEGIFQGKFSGVFNFDRDEESGAYASQILNSGIFEAANNSSSIIGGMGKFACSSGTVSIVLDAVLDETDAPIGDILEFVVCNSCY